MDRAPHPLYQDPLPLEKPVPMPRINRQRRIESAFVLGSTSTVAGALCRALARRGCRRFHLLARNGGANAALATELREQHGAAVTMESVDLAACGTATTTPPIPEIFDLYLVAAGSLGDPERARIDNAEALAITAANYTGLLPWLTAIASPERIRQPGRLWVFASVAGDRGRPSNPLYGAAKAALATFCEGLLLRCHGGPFAVRILKAGYITSPMTAGKAPRALCASAESVARDLLRHPDRRGIEYIPWFWSPIMAVVRLLPPGIASRL